MSVELYAMLNLIFYQVLGLVVVVCCEWFISKNKFIAKKIAERLGLILIGALEATFLVLLCFLFG